MIQITERIKFPVILVFFLLFVSCSDKGKTSLSGSYYSNFVCSDTTLLYTVYFYARVPEMFISDSLPVTIYTNTPDGSNYSVKHTFNLSDSSAIKEVKSGLWSDYKWLYKKEFSFNRIGLWRFNIKPANSLLTDECTGHLGLIITSKQHGER